MKIAIVGHGKMGRLVEEIARRRGHHIVCVVEAGEEEKFAGHDFRKADVAIDFTVPSAEPDNILSCFAAGVPVVCGTTGWTERLPEIKEMCGKGEGTLMWSSNFSIGVNIFRAVNRYLDKIMQDEPQYRPLLTEVHHVHKLDHPSGTAVTLAEELVANTPRVTSWEEVELSEDGAEVVEAVSPEVLPVAHRREGEVPGIHTITWESDVDSITLTHSAKSRAGFALGAVIAAEWLVKQPKGFYTMDSMLSF